MRISVLLAAATLPLALLAAPAGPPGFYLRGAEGWFWYQAEPEPKPPPPPPEPVAETRSESTPPAEPATPAPAPLSAAWLRARLDDFRDAAIDDPTPENVALYLYLQRVAMDKASRFADATRRAVLLDPFLDELTRRPTAPFAANLVNRQAGAAREAALRELADRAGVLFFFRSDCPYCEAQAPLLRVLEARYGLVVYPVSLDGAPLAGGLYPAYHRDAGQAAALGVVSTPALFLARPPDGVVPLAQGLLSLAQLQDRLLLAAREAGWIPEEDYARTRAQVADLTLDVSPSAVAARSEDPAELLGHLRALARTPAGGR